MKRLFGLTITIFILYFNVLSWRHNYIVAKQRYLENGEQDFDRGKHSRTNVELRNAIQIDPDLSYPAVLTDNGLRPESDAYGATTEVVQLYPQHLQARLEPARFHVATHPREDARHKASPLLTTEGEAARKRSPLSEPVMAIGEPAYLALFGCGLTLIGVVLLRRSRLTKPSKITTMRTTPSRIYVQLGGNSGSRLLLTSEFPHFLGLTVSNAERVERGSII
jgi:hypothetical protein